MLLHLHTVRFRQRAWTVWVLTMYLVKSPPTLLYATVEVWGQLSLATSVYMFAVNTPAPKTSASLMWNVNTQAKVTLLFRWRYQVLQGECQDDYKKWPHYSPAIVPLAAIAPIHQLVLVLFLQTHQWMSLKVKPLV